MPSLFLFFFYRPGDHRHLPSFPTRRSSDLRRQLPKPCHGLVLGDIGHIAHSGVVFQVQCDLCLQGPGDRKSTRLNSSHVRSSYAVCCLKKKKKRTKSRGAYSIWCCSSSCLD